MKRMWLFITGSIIVLLLNGAFLCYGNPRIGPERPVIAPQAGEATQLRESLKTILTDPRFKYQDNLSWFKWVYKKITGLFVRPKSAPFKLPIEEEVWWYIFNILGIAVLVILPFITAFLVRHFLQPDKRITEPLNKNSSQALNFGELKQMAAEMAGAGQYREGIRYLYLAGLEKLKAENLLPQASKFSDKVNLKNLRTLIGDNHKGYQAFLDLTIIFQEKWYGLKDCQAPDYQSAESKLELILWNVRG